MKSRVIFYSNIAIFLIAATVFSIFVGRFSKLKLAFHIVADRVFDKLNEKHGLG